MDGAGQNMWQSEFVGFFGEGLPVKCELEEPEYLDENREEIAPAVDHDAYRQEGPPELRPRPGLYGVPDVENPPMPELERRSAHPDMPFLTRALAAAPWSAQEGRSVEPTMPELERRPRLPDMPALDGMAESEPQPAQREVPELPDMSIQARMYPQSEARMPETERQLAQPDEPIPEAMSQLGSQPTQIHIPGLAAPIEIRVMSIETMEYWPQELLRPQELPRPELELPRPELQLPRKVERQPVQFLRQNEQPANSRTGKWRPATPYPRVRSTSAVSSSSPQAGPFGLASRPIAQSTPRQIAAQPQPSTSGHRSLVASDNGARGLPSARVLPASRRIPVDRAFVATHSGMRAADMRSYPAYVEFALDERNTLQLVYRCSVCVIEFNDLKSYNNHMRIEHHRVFCPRCHRSLIMGRLDRHLQLCPAVSCYCQLCDFTTARPCELQQHLRVVHNLPKTSCLSLQSCYFCNGGR